MAHQPIAEAASRIEHDLRTRFPLITVEMVPDEDGDWSCEVRDGGVLWGSVWVDGEVASSSTDAEFLTESLGSDVADNLWPDELTDPWPLCPVHGDHPLQPSLVAKRAVWQCSRDEAFAIRIGELGGE